MINTCKGCCIEAYAKGIKDQMNTNRTPEEWEEHIATSALKPEIKKGLMDHLDTKRQGLSDSLIENGEVKAGEM